MPIIESISPQRQSEIVERELRGYAVDQMRGNEPSTVLGLLIARLPEHPRPDYRPGAHDGLSIEAISGLLGASITAVEVTVEVLQREELCYTTQVDGFKKAVAFAFYTPKNGTSTEELASWAKP